MISFSAANAALIDRIWRLKYRANGEQTISDTFQRVVRGVYINDTLDAKEAAINALLSGKWAPGGRIIAGAGTTQSVTLINCFVNRSLDDNMSSIFEGLRNAAITMQHGGGIGTDFSTLRPRGAIVRGVGGESKGIIPFMEIWDAMCKTIVSAGSRRGAMMGVISDDHPDLPEFLKAKHTYGRLTTFNISILVSNRFMSAIENDEVWQLGFSVPPLDQSHVNTISKDGQTWYVYHEVRARSLWDDIMQSTYAYSEPGVVFIDRINEENNLRYIETIHCTNPCGEQPLPPNGDCNLGAVVLPRFVKDPFTDHATIDYADLVRTVGIGVRFLDNVIDVSNYPQQEQQEEAHAKRRIGLGITGLANLFQMLKVSYGSNESLQIVDKVMSVIRDAAYNASCDLAAERGPFPLFNSEQFSTAPFVQSLDKLILAKIKSNVIRNGVLLTVAPTGTTSILYGNVSSGIEPVFAYKYHRQFVNEKNENESIDVFDWGYEQWLLEQQQNDPALPEWMNTVESISLADHIAVQARCQKYIDASISKTINCSADLPFSEFRNVYMNAFEMGCKSCTTYRPSDVRGSILRKNKPSVERSADETSSRPSDLPARVYKLKFAPNDPSYYMTIADIYDESGKAWPYEIFINRYDPIAQDWVNAFCVTLSAVLRSDIGDGSRLTYLLRRLERIRGSETHLIKLPSNERKYLSSVVSLIAKYLEFHVKGQWEEPILAFHDEVSGREGILERCDKCAQRTAIVQEGCKFCLACGFSSCG